MHGQNNNLSENEKIPRLPELMNFGVGLFIESLCTSDKTCIQYIAVLYKENLD